jgi:hypothetical protein
MATTKALVEQTGVYSQWTAAAGGEHHCLTWLRGNATHQAKRIGQRLKVIDGCAWITFDGKDRVLCSGQEITLVPGRDAAVISRLNASVLVFAMID